MSKPRAFAIGLLLIALAISTSQPALAERGKATWYGEPYHGRRMANGQVFDMYDPTTTASNQYPFGTWLRVTNPENGKSVEVQVRDRGGFSHALDLSYAAFAQIATPARMVLTVEYEVIPGPGQAAAQQPAPAQPTPRPAPTPAPTPVPTAPPAVEQAPPAESNPGTYTVEPGDTLRSIAVRFGLRTLSLAEWNGLEDPNHLKPGQVLGLHPPAPTAEAAVSPPPPTAPAASATTSRSAGGNQYVVQPGDVLWKIALELGVDSRELARANNLGPDFVLYPDQRLVIPSSEQYYEVQEGDTLATIAAQHDISVTALLRLNALEDPDLLIIGQELRVR